MYAIGLDISKDFITSSCVTPAVSVAGLTFDVIWTGREFPQSDTGWSALLDLAQSHHLTRESCQMVMECTGVYSDRI